MKIGLKHALNGLKEALKSESNFRIQLVALATIVITGLILDFKEHEWLAVFIISGLVLCLEVVNTTIEKTLDFINPEHNENIKVIKDISAGAVLIASLTAIVIALIIITPKIQELCF